MSALDPHKLEAYLRRTTQALLDAEQRLEREREARREPIAIISMACRLPGAIEDPESFWNALAEGRDLVGPFPERWAGLDLYDPDPETSGKSYVREGGFIQRVERFDPELFGISPREAEAMDPQQRLLLETSWEALERAGVRPDAIGERVTGIYVGAMGSDYGLERRADLCGYDGYQGTGTAASVMSGRIAYAFGLRGPALTVDTACSSSLVAIHLACSALRTGECELALVGGVMVMSSPSFFVEFSRLKGLAPDGRCKSFGAGADGTSWAEGCGMLLLKRLSTAQRDGDRVLAVVRGSAVNQDGRSQGLTAPNGPAQQRVIRAALEMAGLVPADIDAIEAHGTGTSLGDPVEAGALAAVFKPGRDPARPVCLGSAKSNLGHAQSAAGVIGVMKMVLALTHETLPKSLHCELPTSSIDWSDSGLSLLQQARPWARGERVRRAGVSSFGISGTNAHVVLEEPPAPPPAASEAVVGSELGAMPLVLSGRDPAALREQGQRWAAYLAHEHAPTLLDAASTAALGRTHFEMRASIVARDLHGAVLGLEALGRDQAHPSLVRGVVVDGRLGVLFTGQGSQRSGMGCGLYEASRDFRGHFDALCEALDPHLPIPLRDVVLAQPGSAQAARLDQTELTQPALFALEVALYRLWEGWGLRPSVLVGHSVGELAAAHVAGVLELPDAARLVAARGRLMQRCRADGAMASLEASEEEVDAALAERRAAVGIAGLNGPQQTVISGDADAVEHLMRVFSERGRRTQRLSVSHAFHSHHMDAMLDDFAKVARSCAFAPPRLEICASSGRDLRAEIATAEYWVQQVRRPVRFHEAIAAAYAGGARRFLECGPLGVLSAAGAACLPEDAVFVSSLRKGVDDVDAIVGAIGALHVAGEALAWPKLLGGRIVEAPTYPFQRQSYWQAAPDRAMDADQVGLSLFPHPWLRGLVRLADSEQVALTGRVDLARHAWLGDHCVFESVLLPGTGMVEMALAAGRAIGALTLETLVSVEPLPLEPSRPKRLQVRIEAADEDGARELSLHGQPLEADDETSEGGSWICHARGRLRAGTPELDPGFVELERWPVPGCTPVDLGDFYVRLQERGLAYGLAFRGLIELWHGPGRGDGKIAYARVRLPEAAQGPEAFALHPALLDAALHAAVGLASERMQPGEVMVPYEWTDVSLMASGSTELRVRATLDIGTAGAVVSLCLADAEGLPVARIGGLHLRPLRADVLRAAVRSRVQHQYRLGLRSLDGEPKSGGSQVVVSIAGDPSSSALDILDAFITPSVAALVERIDSGFPAPACVILDATSAPDGDVPQRMEAVAARVLTELQTFVASASLAAASLVLVTRDAAGFGADDGATAFAHSGAWGLVRAVRNEHPERRLRLVDLDARPRDPELLRRVLALDEEPEIVVRSDVFSVVRLERADDPVLQDRILLPTMPEPWRLVVRERGRLDTVEPVSEPRVALGRGEVRVEVRASGLNFRDVLHALGMVDSPKLGLECAGRVLEVGAGVEHLRVGDRVMGMAIGSFGSEIVMDARYMVEIPASLDYVSAATIPLTFLTALYAFEDLGRLRTGERVLIHAAAGGVGMAALQLARHRGAEVFGTASPEKWPVLRALGLDRDHIASSRDPGFAAEFAAPGRTFDVVLNALTGEMITASLSLLGHGGRFLEMGKTDVREPADVADEHPGVMYRAFDLIEAGPDRIQQLLQTLAGLLRDGAIEPLPVLAYDIRRIPAALRFMAQARHVGKLVITLPRRLRPEGTVWITGGTGELGQCVAQHLVSHHGVRNLVLSARRGPDAPGAQALATTLRALGARSVQIVACDVACREDVDRTLTGISHGAPLTAVLHLAGVLDDGLVDKQTPARLQRVLAPKVRGAWNLHEATKSMDLDAFVLFSSIAGSTGGPGQSNYAAANAFLDGLAAWRQKRGLTATSLAWGLWEPTGAGGMTSHLGRAERLRMRRQGIGALSQHEGLRLLDDALTRPDAQLIPAKLELAAMARQQGGSVPPLLRALVRTRLRVASDGAPVGIARLTDELAALPAAERLERLVRRVQAEVAAVLGLASTSVVRPTRTLRELGLDSLMAVELRNRLAALGQISMPATMAFDYPTPKALAEMLLERLALAAAGGRDASDSPPRDSAGALCWAMERLTPEQLEASGLLDRLVQLARGHAQSEDELDTMHAAAELTVEQMDAELDAVLGAMAT